jgi:hypothetical protein
VNTTAFLLIYGVGWFLISWGLYAWTERKKGNK